VAEKAPALFVGLKATDSLWIAAADFAADAGINENSVRVRFNRILVGANGTRDLYEREALSPRGGGLGGKRKQYDIARIARDFPGRISDEEFSRARARAEREAQTSPPLPLDGEIVVTNETILEKPAQAQGTLQLDSPLHALPERARAWAQARKRAIELLLGDRWRAWRGRELHGILIKIKTDFALALAKDSALGNTPLVKWQDINHELSHALRDPEERLAPVKPGALWRWHGWFVNGREVNGQQLAGDAALGDLPRSDAGQSKVFGAPPSRLDFYDEESLAVEVGKLTPAGARAATLALVDHENPVSITNIIAQEFSNLGLAAAPSYSAVKRFLDSFPEPLKLWASGNTKLFHNRCAPYALRDYSTIRVMEGWVLDHAQDDFFVFNDFIGELGRWTFPHLAPHAALRMWLTAFADIRSRYAVGYAFSVNPSSSSICSALRMGVLLNGRAPRFGLLDRGEDMKKMGLAKPDLPEAAQGALRRLIAAQWGDAGRVVFSIGEHPQSKPIERWFGTKRTRFDQRVLSYCGNKPANRPESCERLLRQHDEWKADGAAGTSPLPRASEAIRATSAWIEQSYNAGHHHRGHGMEGATPEQVFRAGYPLSDQKQALAELNPRALDVFLWDVQQRKVFNGGCVRMYGAEYEPADERSRATLFAWVDREVLVAADPHQLGDMVAKHPETGEILGVLQSKQLLAWGADLGLIGEKMRLQRRAGKACKSYIELAHRASARVVSSIPSGPFGFLGESFSNPMDGGLKALPPAPPLAKEPMPLGPRVKPFACDVGDDDLAAFAGLEEEN